MILHAADKCAHIHWYTLHCTNHTHTQTHTGEATQLTMILNPFLSPLPRAPFPLQLDVGILDLYIPVFVCMVSYGVSVVARQ